MAMNMFECENIHGTYSGYRKDGIANTFPIRKKKIIRIMAGAQLSISCRSISSRRIFKQL